MSYYDVRCNSTSKCGVQAYCMYCIVPLRDTMKHLLLFLSLVYTNHNCKLSGASGSLFSCNRATLLTWSVQRRLSTTIEETNMTLPLNWQLRFVYTRRKLANSSSLKKISLLMRTRKFLSLVRYKTGNEG